MTRRVLPWVVLLFGFWGLGAWIMPPVQDEAYYALWARFPALGYFDHPPMVAWIASTGLLAPASTFAARFGTLLVAALTVLASMRFFRAVGLTDRASLWTAVVLANFNVMGLVFGFITTPDTGLMLAWALALGEAAFALKGDDKRWLTAGVATGLGLLSKYTMVLIGPVFLWALIVQTRNRSSRGSTRGLRSLWPYLGGVAALLVFLPNLYWNANNDWITLRFQMRHGLSLARPTAAHDALPRAEVAPPDSIESELAKPFVALTEVENQAEKKPRIYDDAASALNRYVGFYGSQVGLWGAALVVFAVAWRARKQRPKTVRDSDTEVLVAASAWVPLVVFGLLSLGTKVEANWSAMYIFGAAAWLAPVLIERRRGLAYAAAFNLGVGLLLLAHVHARILPVRPHKDRLLKETHGYSELATYLATLKGSMFADSYQLVAMPRFFDPTLDLNQWPGITRDSDLISSTHLPPGTAARLKAEGGLWLVGSALPPPRLTGFTPTALVQLRDCLDEKLQTIAAPQARDAADSRCKTPIHTWYLTRYATQ